MINRKFLLLCLISCFAFSQNKKKVAFREITVEHGLSQNSVVSIAQDSVGFMWFATQDGLNKYDGRQFIYYDLQFEDVTRPTYNKLGKIYVDRRGTLWIVSNSGRLKKYHRERDGFQNIENIDEVSTLVHTNRNDLYIGTYGKGIFKIGHQKQDTIQLLDSKHAHSTIYDFLETEENTIWASTSNGMFKIEGDNYNFVDVLPKTNFSALSKSKNNTLYVGSYGNGLFVKNNTDSPFKLFHGFDSYNLPTNLNIQDLLVDSQDKLWIATYGQGVYLVDFEMKTIQNFTQNKNDPYAMHYNDVLSLFEDNTGTIWLGTDGAGLSYYDEYLVKFNVITNDQVPLSVNVDVIRSIAKDHENTIWVGTSGKGLTRLNVEDQDFFTYTTKNSDLLGDRIMSLLYDGDMLWIGHQTQGLQMMDSDGKITSYKETVPFTIWKIYRDNNNKLWLGTRDHGLINFDINKGIVKQFSVDNSVLTTNNIRTVEQGNNNTLWIGTETDGLFKLNTETHHIEKVALLKGQIKSLYFNDPLLLVGTNGEGLKAYDPKKKRVITYAKGDGLPNNVIYGILPDMEGNIWLSSNKGITKLKIENNIISDIENYTNNEGLQAAEFNTGAYYKDDDGILYFGGLAGLNWFDPNQLSFNPIKPKTIITGFEVFNFERKLGDNPPLKHDENTITFTFSSLHFSQPERNQYKYKLVNNDADWISAGNTNVAHYTNLPPDDYEFQVISSNYDGVWNTNPAKYAFTILSPWYATSLAKGMYVLLIIIFAFYLYSYLKWRWEIKTKLRLEHEETNRLRKLDELKTKLYTNISHEFRTPLTLISGPIDNQLSKPDITKKDKKELSLIKQNADRLLLLVDQMLDLSMIESGQRKLEIAQGNLSIILKQIVTAFQYRANEKKLSISSSIHNLKEVWFDRDIIEKVISNLLTNAIKYAPNGSTIDFEANQQSEMLELTISNECDITERKDLNKLFQRFYQENKLSDGVGVGLALVRELVTLSNGFITAIHQGNNRIQFKVSLPISKVAFDEKYIITEENIEIQNPPIKELDKISIEGKPVLLVVEDESDIRDFIKSIFKNDYIIIDAENGKIGIEKALKHVPDLIISDIMMPITDGIELCNTLKTNELTSHIPIVLLTAKVGEENEIKGIKTGADAYVTKPFHTEKLKIRVGMLIENRKQLQLHFAKTLNINPKLAITSTESEFLERLESVLNEHLTKSDLTSDSFGKLMHMSRTQLHRKLKAITGMSATEFIRSQRLKLAIRILKESDAPISEIAYQVGFNTPSYFNKCFKEIYNCTPNEYLKSIDKTLL